MICARREPNDNARRLKDRVRQRFGRDHGLFKYLFLALNNYATREKRMYKVNNQDKEMTPLEYSLHRICGRRNVCFASFVVAYLDALGLLGMKCIQNLTVDKKSENIVVDFIRRLFDVQYYQQTQLDKMILLSKSSPVKITRQQVREALQNFENKGFQHTEQVPDTLFGFFGAKTTKTQTRRRGANIVPTMMESLEARGYRASVGKLYFFNVKNNNNNNICNPMAAELVFKYITQTTKNTFDDQKQFLKEQKIFISIPELMFYVMDVENELDLKREGRIQKRASELFAEVIQISSDERLHLTVPIVCSVNEDGILMHKAPGETISSLERSSSNNQKIISICIQLLILYLQKNLASSGLMIIHNDLHEGNMMLSERRVSDHANRTKTVEYHVSIIDFGDAECLEMNSRSQDDQKLFAQIKKILNDLMVKGLTNYLEECVKKDVQNYYDWRMLKMASGIQRVIRNIVSKFGADKMASFHDALDTIVEKLNGLNKFGVTFRAIISTVNEFFTPVNIGSYLEGYISENVHTDDGKNWIIILILFGISRSEKIQRIFSIFGMKLNPIQILDVLSSVYRGYNEKMASRSSPHSAGTSSALPTPDFKSLFNLEFIRKHASNQIVFTFLFKLLFDDKVRSSLLEFLKETKIPTGFRQEASLYEILTTDIVLKDHPNYLKMTQSFISFLKGPPPPAQQQQDIPRTQNHPLKLALMALL